MIEDQPADGALALEADPLLRFGLETVADGRPGDRAFAVLFRPLGRLQGAVLGLEDEIRLWGAGWVARRKRLQPAAEPGPPDWPRLAAAAESLYRTEAASNPYGIEDRYFLARRSNDARIAIVVPRRNAQLVLTVSSAGADRVTIGTKDLEARHIVLTEPSGATRDVWVDAKGRVLKVAIPARNLVAQRDDPPAP